VHRLDRGTSGALCFALSEPSRQALRALFRAHRIERRYAALVAAAVGASARATQVSPLRIRAFPVPHRGEYTDTVGVSINDEILYVPDIDDWRAWPNARAEVARHKVCILDGTFFSPDELPGRNLKEISHPFITDTIDFFADLAKDRRIILTHFNHSNPVCDPASREARRVRDAGFELVQEMLAIPLG
jgi:pyrroloquinoline quinone biosynthesis protein B